MLATVQVKSHCGLNSRYRLEAKPVGIGMGQSITILRPSLRERKQKLEGELRRLASTAAETGPSAFLVEAIHECEQQLRQITDQLLAGGADSVDAHLASIEIFILIVCTAKNLPRFQCAGFSGSVLICVQLA
jgi:hypothetical protein